MNFMLQAHDLMMLAGGSIPGDKRPLSPDEQWGVTLAGIGIVLAALLLLVLVIFLFGKIFEGINAVNQQKAKKAAAAKAPKPTAAPIKQAAPAPKAPAPV